MSGWEIVYLVIAIIAAILGIWNLARQRNVFLSLSGILWFLIVLFMLFVKQAVYNYPLPGSLPTVGNLLLLVLLPVFMILAFFAGGRR